MGHREQLLAGAKRCLYERGYARTTARDIVAASGTNLASIGYHFGSKEALLNAAMIDAMTEWGDELERAMPVNRAVDSLHRLEAIWSGVIDSIERNRPLWVANLDAFSQTEHHAELREQLAAAYQAGRAGFAAMVLDHPGGGETPDPTPAPTRAAVGSLVMAVIAGLAIQRLLDPEHAPSADELSAALRAVLPTPPTG
jgi:AcrR family transcriptional regulator